MDKNKIFYLILINLIIINSINIIANLKSAEIKWKISKNPNEKKYPLHISLGSFEVGKIMYNLTDDNKKEKKYTAGSDADKKAGKEYYETLKKIINKKISCNRSIKDYLKIQNKPIFELKKFDIISTDNKFKSSYLFDSEEKIDRFKELALENKIPKSKYKYYLIIKVSNNINALKDKIYNCLGSDIINNYLSRNYKYLPHITLGEIKKINDPDLFIDLIKNINHEIKNERVYSNKISIPDSSLEIFNENKKISETIKNYFSKRTDYNWKSDENIYFILDKNGKESDPKPYSVFLELLIGGRNFLSTKIKELINKIETNESRLIEHKSKNSLLVINHTVNSLQNRFNQININ